MFTSINCTVFDVPLTWDRTRFEASRVKCQQARKLIATSINAQYEKQLKNIFFQKLDIEKDITESQECLSNQEKKVLALDNLIDVASQSLTDYFDKRMENARSIIQEHCNAIQQILREENEHWKEIHSAIDQNLITSDDIYSCFNIEQIVREILSSNIQTIDDIHSCYDIEQIVREILSSNIQTIEEEEIVSKLLKNNKTVTPILTQMIRKSRLQSKRFSTVGFDIPSPADYSIPSKEERFSLMLPHSSTRRTLPVIDTTFVVKLEETRSIEPDQIEIIPIEILPTSEVEASPSFSQPNLPARLYFSPTLLLDDEEPLQPVLSTIDQNRTNIKKTRRFGQTFFLDNIKTEESFNTENLRPKISDEIPLIIHSLPTKANNSSLLGSNSHVHLDESHHSEIDDHHKSMVYSKRQTINEPKPVHMTRRATKKVPKEIDTNKRPTRKRKQSISDEGNDKINTTTSRKKKAVPVEKKQPKVPKTIPAKTNARKPRVKKTKEVAPIREPSPFPIIDRSKHYSTRFSARSHRFNNFTLSTTAMINDIDDDHQPNNRQTRTIAKSRVRTKSKGRNRTNNNHDNDGDEQIALTTRPKPQLQNRAKSMMVTRSRKK